MEKVSIITPSYNSSKYISGTIESVIEQSFSNWEMIIVDDSSNDNSVNIIKSYCSKDDRIKLIELSKNSGAAIARNTAIRIASGRYIAFIDSDDIWHNHKLEIQLKYMQNKSVSFSFTNYYLVNDENNDIELYNSILDYVKFKDIVMFNYIACSTVMYDQVILGKNYMPLIRNRQDWGLWIDLIKKAGSASCIKDYLMYYMVRDDSISSNKFKMIKYHWYIYKDHLAFNLLKALKYLFINILKHLKNSRK